MLPVAGDFKKNFFKNAGREKYIFFHIIKDEIPYLPFYDKTRNHMTFSNRKSIKPHKKSTSTEYLGISSLRYQMLLLDDKPVCNAKSIAMFLTFKMKMNSSHYSDRQLTRVLKSG